jgi:peptide chain release factor
MIFLQLSSSQGPAECELAVAKALGQIMREAKARDITVEVVEQQSGSHAGTYRSLLLALEGEQAEALAQRWSGTLKWVCQSPYRPRHERKNWFIGIALFAAPPEEQRLIKVGDLRFETCRASGPGGQHVNKTDSAVRATHLPSGISVKVQTHRSQQANKQLAVLLIEKKLSEQVAQSEEGNRAERRMAHHSVERGNEQLVFYGMKFESLKT